MHIDEIYFQGVRHKCAGNEHGQARCNPPFSKCVLHDVSERHGRFVVPSPIFRIRTVELHSPVFVVMLPSHINITACRAGRWRLTTPKHTTILRSPME